MEHTILQKIGLRDDEVKAFIFMIENGQQTAGMLAKRTGLSRPSLYGFLKKLKEKGLVIESQRNGVKTFQACTKEKIKSLLDTEIQDFTKGKSDIEKIFEQVGKGNLTSNPKFQFFEGREGVRHVLKDLLLYRDITTKAYWPIKSMITLLSEDFFYQLNKERIRRHIYTQGIWPENQKVDMRTHPYMGVGNEFFREIRIAPKDIDFTMGYWIYEGKVAFISSQKECFGFIIESKEFANMMSSQFDAIWKQSKSVSVPDAHTRKFLNEIQ